MVKDHMPHQFDQLVAAIWTRMFPSPFVCFLIGFDHFSIDQFIVDQGDFPLIDFFFLIQKIKDTISTSQGHEDKVQLLRDLSNGTCEGTVQLQKGHQSTDSQPTDTV